MKRRTSKAQLDLFEEGPTSYKHKSKSKKAGGGRVSAGVRKTQQKIQYGHYPDSDRHFPVIRLAGHWLRGYNFKIADVIEIQVKKGRISITKV